MQYEEVIKSLEIEESPEITSKLKRIKEVETELERVMKGKENHSKLDKLLNEKKTLINQCYFDIENKVKRINEVIDSIKKEAFFVKTQNFNVGNKCLDSPILDELINKSKLLLC